MEPSCFVNGCFEKVKFLWVLNSSFTYSCKNHKIDDKNEAIKCQEFKIAQVKVSGFTNKLLMPCTILTILFIVFSLGKFLFHQNEFLDTISKEIKVIKSQSDLGFKFHSEILTIKEILKNNLDPKTDQKKPLEINPRNKHKPSVLLNKRETLLALSSKEVNLQKKLELLVGTFGILLFSKDSEVLSVAQVDDYNEVLFGLMDGTVLKVNLNSHIHEISGKVKFRLHGINPAKDRSVLYLTGDSQLNIWSPSLNKIIKTLPGHTHWVLAASISNDGKYLATGSSDQQVKIWDQFRLKEISNLSGHKGDVWAVAFSPCNTYLASAGEDKRVLIWDIQSRSLIADLSGHLGAVYSIQITKDLDYLVSGAGDGTVKVWNLKSHKEEFSFEHRGIVRKILLVDDDRVLISAGGDCLKTWDFKKKTLVKEVRLSVSLTGLAVTDDFKYVLTGDSLGRLLVWDFESLDIIWVFGGAKSHIRWVELSEDFRYLAVGDNGLVRIWDLEDEVQLSAVGGREKLEKWNGVFDTEKFKDVLDREFKEE